MKKFIVFLCLITVVASAYAEPTTVTPLKEISTSKKSFQLGNSYEFRNIDTNDVYTGKVTYYRPNGMLGQEAQIEISNFTDIYGKYVPGKITIIPDNHKNFQEFMNYFTMSAFAFVRGSEVSLKPNVHKFIISNSQKIDDEIVISIKPAEAISTAYDDLDCADVVEFVVLDDVYKKGKLYIKANTPIYGIIDTIDENGWCADNAAIYFKKFKTKNVNNKKVTINTDLVIDGFEILKFKSGRIQQFFNYISTFARGKEVDIKDYDQNVKFIIISNEYN